MEYQGWTPAQALVELKQHGFGPAHTVRNEYIRQYLMNYKPGTRNDHLASGRMSEVLRWQFNRGGQLNPLDLEGSHRTPVPILGGIQPGF
jgi:hypothetical protein